MDAHSKGDDDRDESEINYFKSVDPLNLALGKKIWSNKKNEIDQEIWAHIKEAEQEKLQNQRKLKYDRDLTSESSDYDEDS